jgi:hypothetical protein
MLLLAAYAADYIRKAANEVLHPSVFTLRHRHIKHKPIQGLIVQNLAPAPGRKQSLRSGHGMSFRKGQSAT